MPVDKEVGTYAYAFFCVHVVHPKQTSTVIITLDQERSIICVWFKFYIFLVLFILTKYLSLYLCPKNAERQIKVSPKYANWSIEETQASTHATLRLWSLSPLQAAQHTGADPWPRICPADQCYMSIPPPPTSLPRRDHRG